MDIICGKTGLHFSSYAALDECKARCHGGKCPHERSYSTSDTISHNVRKDKKQDNNNADHISDLVSKNESDMGVNKLETPSHEANEPQPFQPISRESIEAMFPKPKPKIKKDSGLWKVVLGIIITTVIAFVIIIIFNNNLVPITPIPTIMSTTTTPISKSEYTKYLNKESGYSIDYPSAWQVTSANGMHTLFEDVNNTKTAVDITLQRGSYQTLLKDFSSSTSGFTIKVNNQTYDQIFYSLFLKTVGSKVRYTYLCDFVTFYLLLDCDYQTDTAELKEFEKTNKYILHMISSFNLSLSVPNEPTRLAANAFSPSITPIFTPSVITPKPTISTTYRVPSPTASSTSSPNKIDTTINSKTGIYNNYYLGLVDDPAGTVGGNGCFDDRGEFIVLINNKNAKDPTYDGLISFLKSDKTDQYPYVSTLSVAGFYSGTAESHVNLNRIKNIIDGSGQPNPPKQCGDFAERLHNTAESVGIRCAFVTLDFPNSAGHACNAFNTTDRGLVYIDDTGSSSELHPTRMDKKVDIKIGNSYIPVSVFPESGWNSTWESLGIVSDMYITWDGNWNN